MTLCYGVDQRDGDLLVRLSILNVKHLHAVRRRERVQCHLRRKGAGEIVLEFGPVVVAMVSRKIKSLVEELVKGIHVDEVEGM